MIETCSISTQNLYKIICNFYCTRVSKNNQSTWLLWNTSETIISLKKLWKNRKPSAPSSRHKRPAETQIPVHDNLVWKAWQNHSQHKDELIVNIPTYRWRGGYLWTGRICAKVVKILLFPHVDFFGFSFLIKGIFHRNL